MRLLILLFIWSSSAIAAPIITKTLFTPDGYIEIWGTNFGEKKNVKPLLWLDYESDNDASLYRINMAKAESHGRVVEDPKNPKNKALTYNMANSPGEGSAGPGYLRFDSNNLYVNVKRFYDFAIDNPELLKSPNGGGINLKVFRLWSDMADAKHAIRHNMHFGYQGKEGVNSGAIMAEYTEDDRGADWLDTAMPFQSFQWINQEIFFTSSDLNVANGHLKIIQDGHKASSRALVNRDSRHPELYSTIFFDQLSNYQLFDKPLVVYYDDIYIDDGFARIMLQNKSSPTSYTDALPLIPIVWQADYIKAKLTHTAKLKSNYYLFVFDSKNTSNAQGFKVVTTAK